MACVDVGLFAVLVCHLSYDYNMFLRDNIALSCDGGIRMNFTREMVAITFQDIFF